MLTCLIGVTYVGSLAATLLVGDRFIPFLGALGFGDQLAAALLIACLAVARSPSSAIAIISEMNAQGPFTAVSLTVTLAPPFPRFTPPALAVSLTVTLALTLTR